MPVSAVNSSSEGNVDDAVDLLLVDVERPVREVQRPVRLGVPVDAAVAARPTVTAISSPIAAPAPAARPAARGQDGRQETAPAPTPAVSEQVPPGHPAHREAAQERGIVR